MLLTQTPTHPHQIENTAGVAVWSALPWDTEQLGIAAARVDVLTASGPYAEARAKKQQLLALIVEECRTSRIRYLSARVDGGDLAAIHALENAGFELIDGIQTFSIQLNRSTVTMPPGTRLFRQRDLSQVVSIGKSAFEFDRFHADPALSKSVADELNKTWTKNCCLGIAADAVLISAEGHRVASYVTCRIDRRSNHGSIGLVATAAWARGKGFAKRTSLAALNWFACQGMEFVEVGTQLRNVPAARLYGSLGFRQISTSFTFRKVL